MVNNRILNNQCTMSELIQLRRRIKAIEATKKIAHAMQLIAMSLHGRLKNRHTALQTFVHEVRLLLNHLYIHYPWWKSTILQPAPQGKNLVIVIGSQRGLCGGFNTAVILAYNKIIHELRVRNQPIEVIAIGRKIIEHLRESAHPHAFRLYDTLDQYTITSIAQELTRHLLYVTIPYTSVTVISNKPRTFFVSKPVQTTLIPYDFASSETITIDKNKEPLWYTDPQTLLNTIVPLVLEGQLHSLVFESFLAEQAARFISMDQSTRNAHDLLMLSKLQYNKLRQARITKELIELSSGFAPL